MADTHKVRAGRIYEGRAHGEGSRVLVDRIWSHGLSREKANLDEWCKTVFFSTRLCKWYGHDPERLEDFGRRYRSENEEPQGAGSLEHLRALADLVQNNPASA
ncbi:DUF488 domain-containing protein [Arthrobacter psychrochitiniphilus]|uniref:DUF488 domain-containing protein n=1 Tax=Arthrobacter psychrochitiniphilus TaxID=291045 RepID=UPI003F7C8C10